MKLKSVHIPRGYQGMHVEVPGAIVNIEILGEGRTRVDVLADADRYAGERPWWVRFGQTDKKGTVVFIEREGGNEPTAGA